MSYNVLGEIKPESVPKFGLWNGLTVLPVPFLPFSYKFNNGLCPNAFFCINLFFTNPKSVNPTIYENSSFIYSSICISPIAAHINFLFCLCSNKYRFVLNNYSICCVFTSISI